MPQPNNLLTDDIILKTALMEFDNNLVLAKTARRDYESKFTPSTGGTIRIRKPTRYVAREGRTAQIQAIDEQYTEISVSPMIGVDVEVTSEQFALQLDDFNREVVMPAMVTLANKVDQGLYAKTKDFHYYAGTAGTAPNSFTSVSDAASLLDSVGIPEADRYLLLKSFDAGTLRSALYNTFNEKFNTEIIMRGSMGNLSGFDCYSVQNAIRPVASSGAVGTPAINGAGQSGNTLVLDGFTPGVTLYQGALFSIAGVNMVNPASREDTGKLAQFVVAADAQADGSGNMTLTLNPGNNGLVLTGPYQSVTALPADNALVTFQATHTKNVFYHREALAFCSIKLPESRGAVFQRNQMNPKSKSSIRMTRSYQVIEDVEIIRFDVLPAYAAFTDYGGILMGS
jgi:hypothetical protein